MQPMRKGSASGSNSFFYLMMSPFVCLLSPFVSLCVPADSLRLPLVSLQFLLKSLWIPFVFLHLPFLILCLPSCLSTHPFVSVWLLERSRRGSGDGLGKSAKGPKETGKWSPRDRTWRSCVSILTSFLSSLQWRKKQRSGTSMKKMKCIRHRSPSK